MANKPKVGTRTPISRGQDREASAKAVMRASFKQDRGEISQRVRGQKMLSRSDMKRLEASNAQMDKATKLREEAAAMRNAGKRMAKMQAAQLAKRGKK